MGLLQRCCRCNTYHKYPNILFTRIVSESDTVWFLHRIVIIYMYMYTLLKNGGENSRQFKGHPLPRESFRLKLVKADSLSLNSYILSPVWREKVTYSTYRTNWTCIYIAPVSPPPSTQLSTSFPPSYSLLHWEGNYQWQLIIIKRDDFFVHAYCRVYVRQKSIPSLPSLSLARILLLIVPHQRSLTNPSKI